MTKFTSIVLLFTSLSCVTFSQSNLEFQRECRITGGIGVAGGTKNTVSVGKDIWVQLAYKLSQNISVATEFENMNYKQLGYYKELPVNPNEVNVVDNNFSLLLKYHLFTKSKVKVALASGWTYTVRQSEYYFYEFDSTSQHWFRNVTSFSDYRIPLLLELEYPVSKKLNVQARVKYNLNPQNGDTYSSGIGLSLKL
jgi:hypothetical protein